MGLGKMSQFNPEEFNPRQASENLPEIKIRKPEKPDLTESEKSIPPAPPNSEQLTAAEVPPAPEASPVSLPPAPPTPETTPPPFLQKPEPPSAEQLAAIEKEREKEQIVKAEEALARFKEREAKAKKMMAPEAAKPATVEVSPVPLPEVAPTPSPEEAVKSAPPSPEQLAKELETRAEAIMTPEEKALSEARKLEKEKKIEKRRAERFGLNVEEKSLLEQTVRKGVRGTEWLLEKFGLDKLGFKKLSEGAEIITAKAVVTGIDTVGSIFGVRALWELPKAITGYFKKKEQRGKVSDATLSLLEAAQVRKKGLPEGVEELVASPVQTRIKGLNERLRGVAMPAKEKLALRKELAQTLKEYRNATNMLEQEKTERVGRVLDLYINNSAQTALATREALNTVTIGIGLPGLRALGYTALAGAERIMKAADDYEKTHIAKEGKRVEKLQAVGEDLYKAAITETYDGLIGNFFKREKSRVQKGVEFISVLGKLGRVIGLAEFEYQLQTGSLTMQEGAQKLFVAIGEGRLKDALTQGGENWVNNAQRLLSYIGLSENPDEAARKLMQAKEAEVAGAMEKGQAAAAARLAAEQARVAGMAEAERATAEAAALEKMKELAIIGKGEGVTHALTRQLENNPAAFGFAGNQDNAAEVHRWAARRAHELAVQNKYINPSTGEEVRVLFDAKNPSQYLLNPDGTVKEVNTHEYNWNPATETKTALASVQEQTIHTRAVLEGRRVAEAEVERIYRVFPFRHRPEEWEVHRGLTVQDAVDGKFEAVGGKLDRSEIRNQHQLQDYIKSLQERSGLKFNKNETVQQYLERANQQLAAGEIRSVIEEAKPAVVEAAARVVAETGRVGKLQIDELARVTFRYDANNNVTGIQIKGAERSMNLFEGRKLLNGNFLDVLRAKYSVTRDLSRAYDAVNTTSMGVAFLRRGLGKLVELGRGESPEAKFLRERISGLIATAEKTHGDVFR